MADIEEKVKLEELDLDDGFGNTHPRECPQCNKQTMYICRPGDFRCRICYEEKWVVIPLDDVLQPVDKKK